jgi:hypothetical protein
MPSDRTTILVRKITKSIPQKIFLNQAYAVLFKVILSINAVLKHNDFIDVSPRWQKHGK